jgi:hypothetical protein
MFACLCVCVAMCEHVCVSVTIQCAHASAGIFFVLFVIRSWPTAGQARLLVKKRDNVFGATKAKRLPLLVALQVNAQ